MDKTKGEKERKKEDSRFVQSARIEKLRGETLIEIAASSPPPKLLINHFVSDGDVEGKKRAIMDPADYSRISLRSIVNDIASDERDDERTFFALVLRIINRAESERESFLFFLAIIFSHEKPME